MAVDQSSRCTRHARVLSKDMHTPNVRVPAFVDCRLPSPSGAHLFRKVSVERKGKDVTKVSFSRILAVERCDHE